MKIHGVTGSRNDGLLSDSQQKALDRRQYLCAKNVQDYWGNQKRNDLYPEIAMPTGFGKGRVVHRLLKSSKHDQILTIVGSKNILLDQSHDVLAGLAMDDTGESDFSILPDLSGRTVLATWQGLTSFSRKHTKRPEFGLGVIDEVHNVGTRSRIELLKWLNPEHVVGLTATSHRATGEFLAPEEYGFTVVDSMPLPQCIDKRWLSPLAGLCVDTQVMLPESVRTRGEINQRRMAQALRQYPHLFSNIAKDIAERFLPSGMKTVIVVNRVEQEACVIAKELMDRGYKVGLAVNEYAAKQLCDRFITLDAIRRYKLPPEDPESIQVLISPQVIGEGFDAPATECVIWACPTLSHVRYTQVIGRGSRRCWMKKYCLIVDYVYMIENYGYSLNFAQFFKKEDMRELDNGLMYVGPDENGSTIHLPSQFTQGGRVVSVVDLRMSLCPEADGWLNAKQLVDSIGRSREWLKPRLLKFAHLAENRRNMKGVSLPHYPPRVLNALKQLAAKEPEESLDEWFSIRQIVQKMKSKSDEWVKAHIKRFSHLAENRRGKNFKQGLHYPRSVLDELIAEAKSLPPKAGSWITISEMAHDPQIARSDRFTKEWVSEHFPEAGEMRVSRTGEPTVHYPRRIYNAFKKALSSLKPAGKWLNTNQIVQTLRGERGRVWIEGQLAGSFSNQMEMRLTAIKKLLPHYPPSIVTVLRKLK